MNPFKIYAMSFVKSGVVPPPPQGGAPPGGPPMGGMGGGMGDMGAMPGGGMPGMGPPGAGAPGGMPDMGAPPGMMPPPGGTDVPPPPLPAGGDAAAAPQEANRRVTNVTLYAELVKARKLIQGLYRHLQLPIPEDVLDDENVVAPEALQHGGVPLMPTQGLPPEAQPRLPGIGGMAPVTPIEPPR